MHKKTQKITVIVIIAIVCISLIGSSFMAIFTPGTETASNQQTVTNKEYTNLKAKIEAISKQIEAAPNDTSLKLALGDAYYQKSRITSQTNDMEFKEDLKKAIDIYSSILKDQDNTDIKLKLAAAAFLSGENELAEKTYTELLKKDAGNIDALYGYGMFLFYEKGDFKQAEEKWQKALSLTTDEQMKKRLEEMIAAAKAMSANASEQKDKKSNHR